jgi:hypothetical protein
MPIRALEMCVTFPMQHMIDQFHQSEQFLTLFQFGIVGCIATHNAFDLCFLKLNIGNKYELCSELKKCPGIFSWFLISMRTYVSAHTKAIVVGRQIDRKIVARTSRFPSNKKVGQLLIEHGVLCGRAHSPTIQSVIHT